MKKVVQDLDRYEQDLNIGSLSEELSPLIESSLQAEGIQKKRKGSFLQPNFLIWIILGCVLRRDLGYPKVLEFLLSPLRWLCLDWPKQILSDGSISKARIRLGVGVMKQLFYQVVTSFVKPEADFYGMRSVAFDGTIGSTPDTEDNRRSFKRANNQKKLNGFPLMRIMTLMVLSTRMILDVEQGAYKGKKTGESTLMKQILDRMKFDGAPYLFHFDALFYSFLLVHRLRNQKQFF